MKENPDEKPENELNDVGAFGTEIVDGELAVDTAEYTGKSAASSLQAKSRVFFRSTDSPPVAAALEGIAANGGAVGSVVLGVWSILGSLLTYWSVVNGILGLCMGVWGLTSKRPRLAWIGIFLCLIGCALSIASISDIITAFLKSRGESANSFE